MEPTVKLDDEAWEETRDAITRHFLGLDASEFKRRYRAGAFDQDEPDSLIDVLAYFPELD